MSTYTLSNSCLTAEVNSFGAELSRVTGSDGTEYLWNADPAYWKRHSPVLFPVVGNFNHKAALFEGQRYPMGQHGFARDTEFTLISQTEDTLVFELQSNEATRKLYPMDFVLQISYVLKGSQIQVVWDVKNPSDKDLHFSIGAHPAFYCPIHAEEKQTSYFIDFYTEATEVVCSILNSDGVLSEDTIAYPLKDGKLAITGHLFDKDALIVEHTDIKKLSLCLPSGKPYVTMDFDAPLFGIWSPVGKNAPFVCLEPWYGRSDRATFEGEVPEREYGTTLKSHEAFHASYTMDFLPVQ